MAAHAHSQLAGRSETNMLDVAAGLREVGVSVDELLRWTDRAEDVPFAKATARFPVVRERSPPPAEVRVEETEPMDNRPPGAREWFPVLPPAHTYRTTPKFPASPSHPADAIEEEDRRRRRAVESLGAMDVGVGYVEVWEDPAPLPALLPPIEQLLATPSTQPRAPTENPCTTSATAD